MDGTTIDSAIPAAVSGLTNVTGVAAGMWHSAALRADGSVWSWGDNLRGQLGSGGPEWPPATVPVAALDLNGVTAIAAGTSHTIALRSDGTRWAWGYNEYGQLGIGSSGGSSMGVPVLVMPF